MNSAPTAPFAFPSGEASLLLNARGPTSSLGIPGYHRSCRSARCAVAFRNVGRKPYIKGGTRQAGKKEQPPKLVSGGDFSNQSPQYCFPEFTEMCSFPLSGESSSYPKRGRIPSSRPAAAALRRERGRQYIFLLQFCPGRCAPRGPASRRNSVLAGELSINHPGECLGQRGEKSHSFPRDHTAATDPSVSAKKSSAASCLQGSFVCSCMLKNNGSLQIHTGLC